MFVATLLPKKRNLGKLGQLRGASPGGDGAAASSANAAVICSAAALRPCLLMAISILDGLNGRVVTLLPLLATWCPDRVESHLLRCGRLTEKGGADN